MKSEQEKEKSEPVREI